MQFTELDSVRYINFYYEEATTNREKALGWILLAINQKDELKNVLIEIFSNIPILQLYSKEESYLWANRKEILEACDVIYSKAMYNSCPLLDNFIEYNKKKEERKESHHLMRLLDNKSGEILQEAQPFKSEGQPGEADHSASRTDEEQKQSFTARHKHQSGNNSK
mmetsp:Transcript_25582/g.19355  ORF Transcript_25582/g.19355 Transcript_25582/m.19355 type:complete len:165 (+) Transcript_25582:339-833(+)